jgi:hypothetical protein
MLGFPPPVLGAPVVVYSMPHCDGQSAFNRAKPGHSRLDDFVCIPLLDKGENVTFASITGCQFPFPSHFAAEFQGGFEMCRFGVFCISGIADNNPVPVTVRSRDARAFEICCGQVLRGNGFHGLSFLFVVRWSGVC